MNASDNRIRRPNALHRIYYNGIPTSYISQAVYLKVHLHFGTLFTTLLNNLYSKTDEEGVLRVCPLCGRCSEMHEKEKIEKMHVYSFFLLKNLLFCSHKTFEARLKMGDETRMDH